MVLCVRCQKQIDPAWPFCPFCGADNRPPENRPAVQPHTHDFSKGYHCLICGQSHGAEGRKAPASGYVYNSYALMVILLFVGAALMLFGTVMPARDIPVIYRTLLKIVGGIFLLSGVLAQEKVMVDMDKREIREVTGIWPFPGVRVTPFSQCKEVVADVRIFYRQYGRQNISFPVNILLTSGGTLGVKVFLNSGDAYNVGLGISNSMGIPFLNKASGVYW